MGGGAVKLYLHVATFLYTNLSLPVVSQWWGLGGGNRLRCQNDTLTAPYHLHVGSNLTHMYGYILVCSLIVTDYTRLLVLCEYCSHYFRLKHSPIITATHRSLYSSTSKCSFSPPKMDIQDGQGTWNRKRIPYQWKVVLLHNLLSLCRWLYSIK